MKYMAHSPVNGYGDPVIEHLQNTARLAKAFAAAYSPFEAELAALHHDLGKYGDLFRLRLEGKASGVDHWTVGAWQVLKAYQKLGLAPALAVHGHHIGLQGGHKADLDALNPRRLVAGHPLGLRLSEADPDVLLNRFAGDGGKTPKPPAGAKSLFAENVEKKHYVAAMLDVRMVFSALVDADYLTTEAHFNRGTDGSCRYREAGPALEPERALAQLASAVEAIRASSTADPVVRSLRDDLRAACEQFADRPPGLYTLTAPTGSGKTISMLFFALKHALKNHLNRIIVVLPYLSLIEQTAEVYRNIFGGDELRPYVLEDHSLADVREEPNCTDDDQVRLLAENWDAPIIITTSVRFFESLFGNRPSVCRKLHNISRSVILIDEVQTLPAHLAVPTLAALSQLQRAYGCSVVLSSATQPAFTSLHEHVKQYAPGGWQTEEIVPTRLNLFTRARRVRVHWPEQKQTTTLEDLAEAMLNHPVVLTIVNVKRQSRRLYELLAARESDGLYHLSTDMCPAHRLDVLAAIKQRLADSSKRSNAGLVCRVVSTQCVETGVDLDFPVVYRAWGPLESLAQAAGRCNRQGRLACGEFYVFLPPVTEEAYPSSAYQLAADDVKKLFRERGGTLDLQDPQLFQDYYREYYQLARVGDDNKKLYESIKILNFTDVAKLYRLIDNDTISVLVPYSKRINDYLQLREQALTEGISREWLRRARPLSISLYRQAIRRAGIDWLEPIKQRGAETGWYIYLNQSHYSEALGLVGPQEQDFLLA